MTISSMQLKKWVEEVSRGTGHMDDLELIGLILVMVISPYSTWPFQVRQLDDMPMFAQTMLTNQVSCFASNITARGELTQPMTLSTLTPRSSQVSKCLPWTVALVSTVQTWIWTWPFPLLKLQLLRSSGEVILKMFFYLVSKRGSFLALHLDCETHTLRRDIWLLLSLHLENL